MRTKPIAIRLNGNYIPLIEGLEDNEDYKKLCELKQYLHSVTKCSFVDGECPGIRYYGNFQCCVHCEESSGYLNFLPKEQKHYLKLFNKKKGFLGSEGCVLPIELRSVTCVAFYCNAQRRELNSSHSLMRKIDIRKEKARRLEYKIRNGSSRDD